MSYPEQPVPVPVHVIGVSKGISLPAVKPSCKSILRTVTLIASDDVKEILPASDNREIAWILAIDADIIISDNNSDADNGAGAYIPCVTPAAGKPNLSGWTPIQDYRVIYAAPAATLTGSNQIRISVLAVYSA